MMKMERYRGGRSRLADWMRWCESATIKVGCVILSYVGSHVTDASAVI